jgi:6-phospho-beta-glucosidase
MDIDSQRLDLIRAVSEVRLKDRKPQFKITWTTDARQAIKDSDFIVTTFRQGGIASRVIDEQVPLKYGVLGQETTGPGGFAMALRTIPVILDYLELIRELAPSAWLLNFTNPAGILTEAITKVGGYPRAVGICDNPSAMWRGIAAFLSVPQDELFLEYYGLNHLGWLSGVYREGENQVQDLIQVIKQGGIDWHWLPFHPDLIDALGVIPNEYLLFYYYTQRSVDNLLQAGQSRAQQIQPFIVELYDSLSRIHEQNGDPQQYLAAYAHYQEQRLSTYMTIETGEAHTEEDPEPEEDFLGSAAEGYSGVMLRLVEGLTQKEKSAVMILNVPNRGAISGMDAEDVVEVSCYVRNGLVRPIAIGSIPDHALGLMKQVKAYERLTIQAAVEGSYDIALKALSLHPLVPSFEIANSILDDYIDQHGKAFPTLRKR